MYIAQPNEPGAEIRRMISACNENHREAVLGQRLRPGHWTQLLPYLHPASIASSQVLITQGASDRTVYFIESGSLHVHYEDAAGRIRLARVGPGSAVGEGSFFSHLPRNATVQAASPCRVWALTPERFADLSLSQPATALAVTLALGALVAERMLDRRKRVSVTGSSGPCLTAASRRNNFLRLPLCLTGTPYAFGRKSQSDRSHHGGAYER